jgi:hypothetical protein
MRSGLGRLGPLGIAAVLMLPPALYAVARYGAGHYCARTVRADAANRHLLACLPAMDLALQQAQSALRPFREGAPGDPGRAEVFGRWLIETARPAGVDIQGLTIQPVGQADPLTPALSADFRCEQEMADIVRLLQSLQADTRIVLFDSLRLRLVPRQTPPLYVLDARMRAHVVAVAQ